MANKPSDVFKAFDPSASEVPNTGESFGQTRNMKGKKELSAMTLESTWNSDVSGVLDSQDSPPPAHEQRVLAGRYILEGLYGSGGMSVIYRAHDIQEDQPVVIKHLNPQYMSKESYIEKELEALRCMRHPGVIKVEEVKRLPLPSGEKPLCLIMEFAECDTLKDFLRAHQVTSPQDMVWFRDIATKLLDAFAHIHEQHVVHRDLKPENVILTPSGEIKVIDFGIAVKLSEETKHHRGGTYFYTAPEVLAGGQTSTQSDVYSLGMILYEMLTGQRTTGNLTRPSAYMRERGQLPPFSSALDDVIMRATAGEAEKRQANAGELLEAFQQAFEAPFTQPETREERHISWLLFSLIVLFLGFAGIYYYNDSSEPVQAYTQTTLQWQQHGCRIQPAGKSRNTWRCLHIRQAPASLTLSGQAPFSVRSLDGHKKLTMASAPKRTHRLEQQTVCIPGKGTFTLSASVYRVIIGPFFGNIEQQFLIPSRFRELGVQVKQIEPTEQKTEGIYFTTDTLYQKKGAKKARTDLLMRLKRHKHLFSDQDRLKIITKQTSPHISSVCHISPSQG